MKSKEQKKKQRQRQKAKRSGKKTNCKAFFGFIQKEIAIDFFEMFLGTLSRVLLSS
ncbi:hypothetical protein [Algoriphagus boritolerans]|uniref:hypothetical protein n=1 Tax=Algoriphagus boritolerans TaxID=308111 RepID=UPI000B116985